MVPGDKKRKGTEPQPDHRSEADPVPEWLLDPQESASRYLASRDLVHPRPSKATLARLRASVPRRGWARDILAKQREGTWWATKATCYRPKF